MAALAQKCCRTCPTRTLPVLLAVAVTQAVNGEVEPAPRSCNAARHTCPAATRSRSTSPSSWRRCVRLAGRLAAGRGWLETAVHRTEAVQAVGLLPFQLSWLTLLCWFDGDWGAALAHGHRAVALAEEAGWHTELPNCLVALATVEAALGREDEARAHLARAARLGAEQSGAGCSAHASRLTGLIELGAGRPAEAAAALGEAAKFALAAAWATRCSTRGPRT